MIMTERTNCTLRFYHAVMEAQRAAEEMYGGTRAAFSDASIPMAERPTIREFDDVVSRLNDFERIANYAREEIAKLYNEEIIG